jgi:hypothetical protein
VDGDIKVNSLVSALERYNQEEMIRLRKEFPNERILLSSGISLGRQSAGAKALVKLATEALTVLRTRLDVVILAIRRRVSLARRLRFLGSLIAAVSSAGLISAIAFSQGMETILAAGINGLASLAALFAGYLDTPMVNNRRTTGAEILSRLIDLSVNRLKLEQELQLILATDGQEDIKIRSLVQRANVLAAEFHSLDVAIGRR